MKLEIGVSPSGAPSSVAERIRKVRQSIAEASRALGRDPGDVVLVGVTKQRSLESVYEALAAGLTDVGENYLQEAREKFALLPAVRKHFIGHVQTNKAKAIVETFDVVQSVDRLDAGVAIARAQAKLGKRVRTLLQINISPAERFGIEPSKAPELARRLREDEGLEVDGVMAIGPITEDPFVTKDAFETAARAFERVGGTTLSLGMSGDWRQALAAGSTMLRLGTALFGART
jgi:pyridoxal phosphate enzyme (YggS family)